jgi:hypothetical protein
MRKNLVMPGVIFLGGGARSQTEESEVPPVKWGFVAVYKTHYTILAFAWIDWYNTTIRIRQSRRDSNWLPSDYKSKASLPPLISLKGNEILCRKNVSVFATHCLYFLVTITLLLCFRLHDNILAIIVLHNWTAGAWFPAGSMKLFLQDHARLY